MTTYPSRITKFVNGVSILDDAGLNQPVNELEARTDHLKAIIEEAVLNNQAVIYPSAPIYDTVLNYRMVYFDGTKWDMVDGLNPIGETLQKFPLGMVSEITGVTNNKMGKVSLFGYLQNVDPSIIESTEVLTIGSPYFLSPNTKGKLTSSQPAASVFVGVFLNSSTFLMNLQYMTTSHVHRRLLLDPTKWQDGGSYLLYPVADLGQLPLPFEGAIITLENKYLPHYGPYTMDVEGLKLVDKIYFEDLLGISHGTLMATITDLDYKIELFWSDPRTINLPGVMSLRAGTDNIVLENQVSGQPINSGSLIISSIPIIDNYTSSASGSLAVKNISVDIDGHLIVEKGPIVEKIKAGTNTSIDREQGIVTINSSITKSVEEEFSDIFLRGALSKIFSNTILTYLEFPDTRQTSAIYKYIFPYNLDTAYPAEIYCLYFGLLNASGEIGVNLRYSISGEAISVAELPNFSTIKLPISQANKPEKIMLRSINGNELKKSGILYFQFERPIDTVYTSGIGIVSMTAKYNIS